MKMFENNDNFNMHRNEYLTFAELDRDKFDEILQTLTHHFESIESGRQGDDWIWIHLGDDKIEIDSFYSMNLEVKGKYKHLPVVSQFLEELHSDCILKVFDPPKIDLTH